MMIQHRDHDYTEATTLVGPSQQLVTESREQCALLLTDVEEVSASVQQVISDLNRETNVSDNHVFIAI